MTSLYSPLNLNWSTSLSTVVWTEKPILNVATYVEMLNRRNIKVSTLDKESYKRHPNEYKQLMNVLHSQKGIFI